MTNEGNLRITTPSPTEIAMSRDFDAPASLVFDAHTRPELVRQWLLGPPGWSFAVCEMDLRVGGKYRWVWQKNDGTVVMGMGGEYREIVRPVRIVATEKFDEPWYPGEALVTTTFAERDAKTTVTLTVKYESREARDGVLKSGMKEGVQAGYDRLETVLAGQLADGA